MEFGTEQIWAGDILVTSLLYLRLLSVTCIFDGGADDDCCGGGIGAEGCAVQCSRLLNLKRLKAA